MQKRCGHVAIVGRPNVGKSTLLNRLIGQKLSATAAKPQTTRHQITGIYTQADAQVIFIDTPGIHRGGKKALNRVLNRTAWSSLADADCILALFEPNKLFAEDLDIIQRLKELDVPVIAVINKVDRVKNKPELFPFLEKLASMQFANSIIPIAALKSNGLKDLLEVIISLMPQQEFIFPEDQLTQQSERFFAAELVREQAIRLLDKELPYAITVEVERFEVTPSRYEIDVVIWVARDSQKAIVIGKGGACLKAIGTRAREAMQHMFGQKVHLQTWVKVKQDWADDEKALQNLGYGD